MALKLGFNELLHLKEFVKVPSAGLSTTVQKIKNERKAVAGAIKATLKGNDVLSDDKTEFLRLLRRNSTIQDIEIGELIHKEFVELASKTGIPPEASLEEAISSAKEAQGVTTRKVPIDEVADFSLAKIALSQLRAVK
jgi:hypothetical protein